MATQDAAHLSSHARGRRSREPGARAPAAAARARLIGEMLLARGRRHSYGRDPSQHAELFVPTGPGPHAVVVLIHGGSWSKRYGKEVMRGLARDARRRGFAVWNIEYRRLGNGGGWPHTFADVGAAIDHLRALDAALDLARVSVVGHSAGGHLALWAAGRSRLAPGAPGAPATPGRRVDDGGAGAGRGEIRLVRAVALAGVCDLEGAYRRWHGGAARALMGGSPQELPERFAIADPMAVVPLEMPVLLVHGVEDATVSVELSRSYARAAAAAGGSVELVELEGPQGYHRAHIDPRSSAWRIAAGWLEHAVGPLPAPERAAQSPPVRYSANERASSTSSRTP
jgi:acetyl esterase/lipase